MHYLLERQLKKVFNDKFQFSSEWEAFLKLVSNTYDGYDKDRKFLEHSFDISSKESLELNNKNLKLLEEIKAEKENVGQKVVERTKELKQKMEELDHSNQLLIEEEKKRSKSQKALLNILEDVEKEKKKAEAEKEKTMALISNFSTPIIFLNNNDKLALFNPSAREILGIGKTDLGVKVANSNNFSLNNFINIIHNKFSVEKITDEQDGSKLEEVTIQRKGEERVYKVITSRVLEKNGNYLGVMKIFYDTTREKAIDKMKSEFISIAAHQLRTPLSAIKWVIKMILDGDAGELTIEQQELLNKGYLSNERIIRLVNDLLDVSRIEEGKFGFNFEKADFLEVLNTAISNVESLVAKNHQELTIKKPPNLPKIFLDKERMVMVLQNLLSNAIKYTPEYGKIQVIIEVDKQNLHVKINDQGVGIPAEDQPKLFSKFFRAANVAKLDTDGTGLGLFMVKNIVEKHNGRVSLKSEEGKGTEVSFFIPINQATNL
ncbi:MAG: ATP-binding protein [bacterium]|nr:ATP-binding protein [bacterium]